MFAMLGSAAFCASLAVAAVVGMLGREVAVFAALAGVLDVAETFAASVDGISESRSGALTIAFVA
jgi:hypothetical protein